MNLPWISTCSSTLDAFVCTSWIIVLNLCSCFISKSISTPTSYLGPYLFVYHIERKLLISPSQLINMKNWTMQLSQCHYMGQSSSKAIIFSYWTVLEIIVPCANGTSTNSVSTLFKSYTSSKVFCTGRPFHYYLTRFFKCRSTRTVKESIVVYFRWSATFNRHANGFVPINLHRIHTQDPLKEIDYFYLASHNDWPSWWDLISLWPCSVQFFMFLRSWENNAGS
jgi:hypothetical protein